MKTFSIALSLIASVAALALGGLNFFRLSMLSTEIENQMLEQTVLLQQQASAIEESTAPSSESVSARTPAAEDDSSAELEADEPEEADLSPADTTETAAGETAREIEPGEFSQKGYSNLTTVELLSLERLPSNPDVVNVSMRVRRDVEEISGTGGSLGLNSAKGRNPQTNEVYRAVTGKYTSFTTIRELPYDTWANAYFWLEVPEEVNLVDIVIPESAIFEDVPISE